MITTKQAIEAIKTVKEFCEQRRSEPCKTCIFGDYFCDSWNGAWCILPEDWQIPQERTEEHEYD